VDFERSEKMTETTKNTPLSHFFPNALWGMVGLAPLFGRFSRAGTGLAVCYFGDRSTW
jgi:hypothetical protein